MEERPLIEKYEMSLDYVGCHLGSDLMVAKLTVEPDLTDLLPYINAEAEKAKYIPDSRPAWPLPRSLCLRG